ncbi:MAG TPA: hypothetical protein PKJ41_06170 [Bryobacteraceae bacterium]|nr:hypothetical protein [Bryobacteraceae bacterium]HPT27891.1 hypothetical protein [Bryobacteraceae bacterium]
MNQSTGGPSRSPEDGFAPWVCRAAAGLDCGFIGAAAVLVWLICASVAGGGFWFSRLNLGAAPFFGDLVFSSGAGRHTLIGAALLLLLYSLLGAVYAFLPASRDGWLNLLTALGYAGLIHLCADAWLWKTLHPFAPPYFAPLAVAPAHLLYGLALWRFPERLRGLTTSLGNERSTALLAPDRPHRSTESYAAGESAGPGNDVSESAQTPISPAEPHHPDGGEPPSSLE